MNDEINSYTNEIALTTEIKNDNLVLNKEQKIIYVHYSDYYLVG